MKVDKVTIILIIFFILVILGVGFLFNYFLKETQIPELREETKIEKEKELIPGVLEEKTQTVLEEKIETKETKETKEEKEDVKEEKKERFRVFHKNQVLTFKIYKEKIYFYDLKDKTLSYYNFQNDLIIPLYKNEKILDIIWGPDDNLFLFKTWQENKFAFFVLDVLEDSIYSLREDIKEIDFLGNNFIAHIKSGDSNYFALLDKKGKILKKIKDVSFEEIKIKQIDKNNFLVFELPSKNVSSYVWVYNVNGSVRIISDDKPGVFAIPVFQTQILINKIEENVETKIVDSGGRVLTNLPAVLAPEKCTNYNNLVCAVGQIVDLDAWYFYKVSSNDNEIFIYYPKKNEVKILQLEKYFDILYPQIFQDKLYFIDKNSWRLYEYELNF